MVFARIESVALTGLEASAVSVEVDRKKSDKFLFVLVGLPNAAVKESKDRVFSALGNSGWKLSPIHCTINLAPGDLKKEGPLYDLPIALALLLSEEKIHSSVVNDFLVAGELSLSGDLQPMRGAISAALLARALNKKGIILPAINAKEASLIPGIQIIGVETLSQAARFLNDSSSIAPASPPSLPANRDSSFSVDLADIKGHAAGKRALEIAAAGGHNLLFFGPPGSGKTLLAKALASILPSLTLEESLEITRIYSIAGELPANQGLISERPFRAPHHTISRVGLVGGGTHPKPGELSLAHLGVLFLDELPEFPRSTLEVLRQPLENRYVSISRSLYSTTFPTNCLCIAAMNPCPCGLLGHPVKPCQDTPAQIQRYRSRISGPLLDRIDLHVEIPHLCFEDISRQAKAESSLSVKNRVEAARILQRERLGPLRTNSSMSSKEIASFCQLKPHLTALLRQAMDKLGLSARGYGKMLKVARTIADLEQKEEIEQDHLMEALGYRSQQHELPTP